MPNYHLYLDESGTADPCKPDLEDKYPFFSMGGILFKEEDKQHIQDQVVAFHERWELAHPLHSVEIRHRRKRYSWLATEEPETVKRFYDELTALLTGLPVVAHACVISRHGYMGRYEETYGKAVWELRKSALNILLDRSAKFVRDRERGLTVDYEKVGKDVDRLVESLYKSLKKDGLPFDATASAQYAPLTAAQFAETFKGIRGTPKSDPIMQLADLMLFPMTIGHDKPDNVSLVAMRNAGQLVDQHLEADQVKARGIKYYCFPVLAA